jgi:hypothetical protein
MTHQHLTSGKHSDCSTTQSNCLLRDLPPLQQCSTGGAKHGHCPYCPAVVVLSTGARCCGVCYRDKRETEGTPPWGQITAKRSAPEQQDARRDPLRLGVIGNIPASSAFARYRATEATGGSTPYGPLSPRCDAYLVPYSPTSPRFSQAVTPVYSPLGSPRYDAATPRYSASSPAYTPSSPAYASLSHERHLGLAQLSPVYSPAYSPAKSPAYSPTSPAYSPSSAG